MSKHNAAWAMAMLLLNTERPNDGIYVIEPIGHPTKSKPQSRPVQFDEKQLRVDLACGRISRSKFTHAMKQLNTKESML